eukprot:755468-Pelagomonas_calceolata.AAC.5
MEVHFAFNSGSLFGFGGCHTIPNHTSRICVLGNISKLRMILQPSPLLLLTLTEKAWSSAMDAIILTEFVDNKAAAALYRRLGFILDKVGDFMQWK